MPTRESWYALLTGDTGAVLAESALTDAIPVTMRTGTSAW